MIDNYDLSKVADQFRLDMDTQNDRHALRFGFFPKQKTFTVQACAPCIIMDLEQIKAVRQALNELIAIAEGVL